MDLISLIVVLVVVGLVLVLLQQLPIDPSLLTIIRVLVILFVCLWLLQTLGLFSHRVLLR